MNNFNLRYELKLEKIWRTNMSLNHSIVILLVPRKALVSHENQITTMSYITLFRSKINYHLSRKVVGDTKQVD